MIVRKSFKRNVRKAVFITITVLIAIGLVIPIAGLFQKQPGDSGASSVPGVLSPQERIAGLEDRVKQNPEDKALLMELAEAYFYAGKPDQAVSAYEQVLAVDPGYSEARVDIATIYYYSGMYDQAIAQLQELIKNDPDHKEAHYLYGIILGSGKKDYIAGAGELEKYVELAKEGPDVEKAKERINEWKKAAAPQN